jgi:hypothetical protein
MMGGFTNIQNNNEQCVHVQISPGILKRHFEKAFSNSKQEIGPLEPYFYEMAPGRQEPYRDIFLKHAVDPVAGVIHLVQVYVRVLEGVKVIGITTLMK